MIQRQSAQRLANLAATETHGDLGWVERFREQAGQQGRCCRCVFRRLDHAGIARGQNACQRRDCQMNRKIPRRDHTHNAERLMHDCGAGTEPAQDRWSGPPPLWFHPGANVVAGVFERADRTGDIRELAQREGPAAKVLVHRGGQCVVVVDEQSDAAVEPVAAYLGRGRAIAQECVALSLEHRPHGLRNGVG